MKLAVLAKEMLASTRASAEESQRHGSPFSVPLIEPGNGKSPLIDIEGVIDLIEEDDVITEFKTSAQMMDSKEAENPSADDLQLRLREALSKTAKGPQGHRFREIQEAQDDHSGNKTGRASYQRLYFFAAQILKGINLKIFFPRTSFWCKDCEYGENCKAWKGN